MGIHLLMLPDEQAPSLKSIQTTANALASNVLASSRKHGRYDAYVAMLAAAVISQKATTPTLGQLFHITVGQGFQLLSR